jgi:hypothetical protein
VDAHSLLAVTLIAFGPVAQTPADPPTLRIPRVTTPPALEDYLDGHERTEEARVTGLRQNRPGDGEPVSQPTTAFLSYDDRYFYAIFVCRDSEPDKIRARLTKREAMFGDDMVGIVLDTFHDRRRAYAFLANPLGVQGDLVTTDGQGDDMSFDTVWQARGRLTADGYVVWMAIPFKSLRFPSAPTQTWGIAVARIIPRANEQSFWPYITTRIEGFAEQLATLSGVERISPGRNAQVIPYSALASSRVLNRSSAAYEADRDVRVGLDAKLVLRDALTVDLALNPDFSQVESDEPQVTINQRFEVFFPEKRPFFLENAGFFQTPINLFFSRRIADPQFGARLTGKAGGWTIGALAMDDRAPGQRVAEDDDDFGVRAGAGIVRVQRELGRRSAIGLLAASRGFGASANHVAAADVRFKLNANWVFTGQAAASATRDPDDRDVAGPAYNARIDRGGRNFAYSLSYTDRSPGFRSELGFVPRVDIREANQFITYSWRPKARRLVRFGPYSFTSTLWDHQQRQQDWLVQSGLNLEWTGQTYFDISHSRGFELFDGIEFRKQSSEIFVRSEWLKWLALSAALRSGTDINFFPADGLEPFIGASTMARGSLTLRPMPHVIYDLTYVYSRLNTSARSSVDRVQPGMPIFSNHIIRSRVNYQFTRELSLRAIVDYNGVARDASLVSLDPGRRVAADLLGTYLVNPWTAVYVGYTDAYENLLLEPDVRPLSSGFRATSTGRQFFVKLGYLWRF